MKKNILKIICFLAILFLLLKLISYVSIPKNNSAEVGVTDASADGILGETKGTVDIVIVGDSEALANISPMKMWDDYGYTSYVCATTGQSLPDSFAYAVRAINNQDCKMVILEADTIYNPAKLTRPIVKALYAILPIIEYHDRWKILSFNDLFGDIEYTCTTETKGYYYSNVVQPANDLSYMDYSEEKESISLISKLFVKLLKKYCEIKNVEFMIVSTPSTTNWNYLKHNGLKEFTHNEGIEFLDMNVLNDRIKIDWKKDSRDGGDHLNHSGAVKVSEYLGKYLNKNHNLENHKHDDKFKSWNEDYEKYKEIVSK